MFDTNLEAEQVVNGIRRFNEWACGDLNITPAEIDVAEPQFGDLRGERRSKRNDARLE